uniref:Homoserine kinase n=1 Tax=Pinguiococcus pyrenoidosus TaxID=172671 RepID=A0A7R9UEC2_9STRA
MQSDSSPPGEPEMPASEPPLPEAPPAFRKVTVRVPATTANMGPGFDCLGMALDLWSELTVEYAEEFSITYEGEGEGQVPLDATNLVVVALEKAFETAGKEVPTLHYHCVSRIPFARGLGSSSAAIVAGLIAGLVLAGHRLAVKGSEELLQLAANIEGHPDNVAPAIYGGIQLGIHNGERWASEQVPCPPGLQCIMFIPDMIGKTSDARAVLPDMVDRRDAIFNIGRIAWLINALSTNNLDSIKHGCEDKLHQPQRGNAVYRHLYPLIEAAREAGAKGTWLSGAGPTVMAITSGRHGDVFAQQLEERRDRLVARAMADAAKGVEVDGQVCVTSPSLQGAHVSDVELMHPSTEGEPQQQQEQQQQKYSLVRNLSKGALQQMFF